MVFILEQRRYSHKREVLLRVRRPESWDWWRLDGVRYHGSNLTILFDRDGTRYGKGKGLVVLKDGRKIDDFI